MVLGVVVAVFPLLAQRGSGQSSSTVYEGGRLIIGDLSATIEDGSLVVQNGRIVAVGRRGEVPVPAGATRVGLTGKTVMPTLNNVHLHIGYEGFTSWSAKNHTADNVLDHLRREAFYGVGAAMTMGDQPSAFALAFERDQKAGKFAPRGPLSLRGRHGAARRWSRFPPHPGDDAAEGGVRDFHSGSGARSGARDRRAEDSADQDLGGRP
jgi:hypothetical protein